MKWRFFILSTILAVKHKIFKISKKSYINRKLIVTNLYAFMLSTVFSGMYLC